MRVKETAHKVETLYDSLLTARKRVPIDSGIKYRIEFIAEKNEVIYINDAKALDLEASYYSLSKLNGSVVWIGCFEPTEDLSDILALHNVYLDACILIRPDSTLNKFKGIQIAKSLKEALDMASICVKSGSIVLFSPGAPVYEFADSFVEAGNTFNKIVLTKI